MKTAKLKLIRIKDKSGKFIYTEYYITIGKYILREEKDGIVSTFKTRNKYEALELVEAFNTN